MKFWTLMDAREQSALVISAAIVITVIGYWAVQIEGVRAMLKLAYPS